MLKTFLAELKRRNVLRVAGVYAVVGWGILRIADGLFPALNLPQWTITLVAVLLMVAFPIALIITWAFELTPNGIKRTDTAIADALPPRAGWLEATLLVAILAVIGLSVFQTLARDDATDDPRDTQLEPVPNSLAVLPFASFSDDNDDNYFADGLTEEIIHDLAQVPGLKVSGRTSSFFYKNQGADLRDIARTLGVGHVLEGSVRRSGTRVRITAQLISAGDGFHLWSQTYERELDDIFAIQDDVAGNVVTMLQGKLLDPASTLPATTVGEPYQQYLIGVALLNDRSLDSLTQAQKLFQGLLDSSPDNVDALAGFAEATIDLAGAYLTLDFETAAAEAARAVERALQLDENSIKANLAAGLVYQVIAHRSDERRYLIQAEQMLARALQRAPNDADVLTAYGSLLNEFTRYDAAAAVLAPAVERDPLAAPATLHYAAALQGLGRLGDASVLLQKFLALNPNHGATHLELGELLISQGLLDQALPHVRAAHQLRNNPRATFALAHVYLNLGMLNEVERTIHEAQYAPMIQAVGQAIIFNMRGETDRSARLAQEQLKQTGDRLWRPLLIATALKSGDLATARQQLAILEPTLLAPRPDVTNVLPHIALHAANLLMREGAHEAAQWILQRLLERLAPAANGYDAPSRKILRAKALAELGRNNEALTELEQAHVQGFRTLWDFDNFHRLDEEPQFVKLNGDSRFRAFIKTIDADNAATRARLGQTVVVRETAK